MDTERLSFHHMTRGLHEKNMSVYQLEQNYTRYFGGITQVSHQQQNVFYAGVGSPPPKPAYGGHVNGFASPHQQQLYGIYGGGSPVARQQMVGGGYGSPYYYGQLPPGGEYGVGDGSPLKHHQKPAVGSVAQAQAAAAFFARNPQKLQAQKPKDWTEGSTEDEEEMETNFRAVVGKTAPPLPSNLVRKLESTEVSAGKVRVLLKMAASSQASACSGASFYKVDKSKKQVTLFDPVQSSRGEEKAAGINGVIAPKMFAFDGLFTEEDTQLDLCTSALPDVVSSVVNGNDGAVFCFGHAGLGKTHTMIGGDRYGSDLGVTPTAIAWLFRAIKERKQKTQARFSVRVSAVEVTSQREEVVDLLKRYSSDADQSPSVYLRHLPVTGASLQNQSELRASSAEKAAFYLDAALANRTVDACGRESHLFYTLHVYQYSVDRGAGDRTGCVAGGGVVGGRSRLHLVDFGGCQRTKVAGGGITLSGLGNVILGIFNGQKHLPFRDSRVTMLLRDCLGSLSCQTAMIAHVSPEPSHYSESLHTIQLASRVHRMRRKRLRGSGGGSSSGSSGSGPRISKLRAEAAAARHSGSSDFTTSTEPSSSEQSCDTVVYLGNSDSEGTDLEGPPVFIPQLHGGEEDRRSEGLSVVNGAARGHRRSKIPVSQVRERSTPAARIHHQNPVTSPFHQQQRPSHLPVRKNSSSPSIVTPPVPEHASTNVKMPLQGIVPRTTQVKQQEAMKLAKLSNNEPIPKRSSGPRGGAPNGRIENQPPIRMYGYMDEHKRKMIQHWVVDQTHQINYEPLTQFKQAESDESLKDFEDPPRQEKASDSSDPGQLSEKPLEAKDLDVAENSRFKRSVSLQSNEMAEGLEEEDRGDDVEEFDIADVEIIEVDDNPSIYIPMCDTGCQVTEEDIMRSMGLPVDDQDEEEDVETKSAGELEDDVDHPLRVLSEMNLTVVSSFAGENPGGNGDIYDYLGCGEEDFDPSRLSFFGIPNMEDLRPIDNDTLRARFDELAKMHEHQLELLEDSKLMPNAVPDWDTHITIVENNGSHEITMSQVKDTHLEKIVEEEDSEVELEKQMESGTDLITDKPNRESDPVTETESPPSTIGNLVCPANGVEPGNHANENNNSENLVDRHKLEGGIRTDGGEKIDTGEPRSEKESSSIKSRLLRLFGSKRSAKSKRSKSIENKESRKEIGSGRRSKSCDSKGADAAARAGRDSSSRPGSRNGSLRNLNSPARPASTAVGRDENPDTPIRGGKGRRSLLFSSRKTAVDRNNERNLASFLPPSKSPKRSTTAEDCGIRPEVRNGSRPPPPTQHVSRDRKSSGYDSLGADSSDSDKSSVGSSARNRTVSTTRGTVNCDSEFELLTYSKADVEKMAKKSMMRN